MADDVVANPGAGGATFRTLDDGTREWPTSVASYATTLSPGANVLQVVTPANGLPVAQSGTWNVGLSTGSNVIGGVTQSGTWTVSGPLTDTQLRASAVPVSLSSTTITGTVAVTQSGTWSLAANQSVNMAQYNGVAVGATNALHVQPGTGASFTVAQATPANLQTSATQVLGSAATRWFTQISDGTNSPAVKAASTAAVFTDPALTVDARPGGALVTAAAALADGFANPTVGNRGVLASVFNGSTWDRQRGMSVATTTGDTGAKVATGNGATQTNVGNKGLQLFIVLGAVSGTTPTCVFKLQGSVDGGTNWFDIPGAATASLTASTNVGMTIYPGIVATAASATTGTTLTLSGVIPRSWRVVWTIGGTTPSFTITSITYNYLPN